MPVNNHRDASDEKSRPNSYPRQAFALDLALSSLGKERIGEDDSNVLEGLKELAFDREFADPEDPHREECRDPDFEADLETDDPTDCSEEFDVSTSTGSQFLSRCRNSRFK